MRVISPTTLYLLRAGLERQEQLDEALSELGINPLNLDGSIQFRNEHGEAWGMIPPIAEETPEDGMYLVDGAHRSYRARLLGRSIVKTVVIRDFDDSYPFYAIPNNWEDIVIRDEVPTNLEEKKLYRVENPYNLYRDFSSLAIGGPRSTE